MDNESGFPRPEDEEEGLRILGPDPELPVEGEGDLPHWTEPAGGMAADPPDATDPGSSDAWSALTSGDPQWGEDLASPPLTAEPGAGGSGLDAPTEAHSFSFDNLGVGAEPPDASVFDPPLLPPEQAAPELTSLEPAEAFEPDPADPAGEPSGGRNVPLAIGVGIGIAAIALICFAIGKAATIALITVVLVLAAAEFFNALRLVGYQPATLLGVAACGAAPLAVYWRGETAYPLVIFLTIAMALLWYFLGVGTERPVPNVGVTVFVVGYVGLLGSFAALMLKFPNGVGMLIAAIVATVAYDVGGYFIGSSIGRSPLSTASPNKTVEGLMGGCLSALGATVVVVGIGGLTPFGDTPGGFGEALLLGIVVAVAAPLGDLSESMIKRDLGIKDMGTILPGHGGFLDRFDSLLFVLPATYYLARLLDLF